MIKKPWNTIAGLNKKTHREGPTHQELLQHISAFLKRGGVIQELPDDPRTTPVRAIQRTSSGNLDQLMHRLRSQYE